MTPVINVDASEAQSFKPIPEDTYAATIEGFKDVGSGDKARYLPIVFQIEGGEYEGRKLYRNFPIEGKGVGFLVDLVNIVTDAGLDADDLADWELDTDELLGGECGVVVGMHEYPEGSGEMRNEITRIVKS